MELSNALMKYLDFTATLHRSLAYKWLAIDAGETRSEVGVGIAFLSLSSTLLTSSSVTSLASSLANISLSSSSGSSLKTRKKSALEAEQSTITHWLSSYRKLNDTVSFQRVPPASQVTAKVPAGRAALLVKEYKLPPPHFGPGSTTGYSGRARGLELDGLEEDHPARKGLVGLSDGGQNKHSAGAGYAGQGAYY